VFETIAIAGATGAVGRIIRTLLVERDFPARRVKMLASRRSAGQTLQFRGESVTVEELCPEAFHDVELCIASTPDDVAREFVPAAVKAGCVVVDESGAWRMEAHVPLIVPEVNAVMIADHQGIIASPNCSTTQMVVAMKPLHDIARIRRVIVSTYQATSGAGVLGESDLLEGTRAALAGKSYSYRTFKHPIAWNLIPQIGSPKHQGYTSEEIKMVLETRKIFDDPSIEVCPTCVRVPVSNCHSESILVETEKKLTVEDARALWKKTPGICVVDNLEAGEYPMPHQCSGRDEVFIGRIREDISSRNGIAFWCVSDNLRKGAATNAVQIAELLAHSKPARV
jgi:aspartate-semialdehyde dehydrogenase